MSREWQPKRYKQFVMPEAVYFQCLWAVRDLYRMEQRVKELEKDSPCRGSRVSDQSIRYGNDFSTCEDQQNRELQVLKQRVAAIYEALDRVPEEYQENILGNIILRIPGKMYHGKMWKYWKQRFLYDLAKKFTLI